LLWQQGDLLPDNISLKLGERTENMKDQLPTAGRRINVFGDALKADLLDQPLLFTSVT